jgi:hypothetical protein
MASQGTTSCCATSSLHLRGHLLEEVSRLRIDRGIGNSRSRVGRLVLLQRSKMR